MGIPNEDGNNARSSGLQKWERKGDRREEVKMEKELNGFENREWWCEKFGGESRRIERGRRGVKHQGTKEQRGDVATFTIVRQKVD